jgi:hypothetical protein
MGIKRVTVFTALFSPPWSYSNGAQFANPGLWCLHTWYISFAVCTDKQSFRYRSETQFHGVVECLIARIIGDCHWFVLPLEVGFLTAIVAMFTDSGVDEVCLQAWIHPLVSGDSLRLSFALIQQRRHRWYIDTSVFVVTCSFNCEWLYIFSWSFVQLWRQLGRGNLVQH